MRGRPERARRRRGSPTRVLRPFRLLLAVLAILAAVGLYLLSTWPALYPHTIDVEGNRVVSKDQIVERAHINLARNMWLQNTRAMAARIEAIPYIDTARIARRPPDTIAIRVTERVPFAFVDSNGARVTVDRTLRVLQNGAPPALAGTLPVLRVVLPALPAPGAGISSADVQTLAACAADLAAADVDARSLGFDRFGDVTVVLRNGVQVMLGDRASVTQKIPLIEPILQVVDRGRRKVAAIDLRAITTPVVIYAK
ncbi:MAG TPA: FtsQ-type POTRA domain-containing protein [Candidatus Baltobacteraceae bacterium]|nr:FtsQ-type POTRA domain-containing protein [Candidatus Baltobacteraceae bacterium]